MIKSWARHCTPLSLILINFWQHFCSNQLAVVESQNKQAYFKPASAIYWEVPLFMDNIVRSDHCHWTVSDVTKLPNGDSHYLRKTIPHNESVWSWNHSTPLSPRKIQSGSVTMVKGVVTLVLWLDWGRKKVSLGLKLKWRIQVENRVTSNWACSEQLVTSLKTKPNSEQPVMRACI